MKSKMREKVRPKMGKIDIDYQKLHDAFFKWQTKPKLTIHGDLYYEVGSGGGEGGGRALPWVTTPERRVPGALEAGGGAGGPLASGSGLSTSCPWMGWHLQRGVLFWRRDADRIFEAAVVYVGSLETGAEGRCFRKHSLLGAGENCLVLVFLFWPLRC